jgi:hypothetical protein
MIKVFVTLTAGDETEIFQAVSAVPAARSRTSGCGHPRRQQQQRHQQQQRVQGCGNEPGFERLQATDAS